MRPPDLHERQVAAQRATFEQVDQPPGEKRPFLDVLLRLDPARISEICRDFDCRAALPAGATESKALKDVPEEAYAQLVKEGREARRPLPLFVGDGGAPGAERYRRQFEERRK